MKHKCSRDFFDCGSELLIDDDIVAPNNSKEAQVEKPMEAR